MEVTTQYGPGFIVTDLTGRFDAHTVGRYLTDVAEKVDGSHATVVVDLSGVEFMDSSALAALITTLKRAMEHGGDVILAGVSDAARIILELTRLDEVFTRAESREAALAQLKGATV
ncbi:MAG: STAS domain-containing protein [Acidimicrobiia bacterium]|nr:STAS domain-containing protein [Acidimicrobiia bacterium]